MKLKKLVPVLLLVAVIALVFVTPAFALDGAPPAAPSYDLAFISQLLQALVLATLPVLVGSGTRWVIAKIQTEQAKLSNEQQTALRIFVKTAVFAAEQMELGKLAQSKFNYATELVQQWLDDRGMTLSLDEIEAHIEAAVKEQFNSVKLQAAK